MKHGLFDQTYVAAGLLAGGYLLVWFTYTFSRIHFAGRGGVRAAVEMAILVVLASAFLGAMWASEHFRDCNYAGRLGEDRLPLDVALQRDAWCNAENSTTSYAHMLAVLIVLGTTAFIAYRRRLAPELAQKP